MQQAGPSRRRVLAGTAALVLGACTGRGEPAQRPTPDPDGPVRRAAVTDLRALAALYAATLTRHPSLRAVLEPLAAEHAAHLEAMGSLPATQSPAPTSPVPSPSTSRPPAVPATPAQSRRALAAAERAAASRRVTEAAEASPSLARLLASMGACEAGHAALLTARGEAAG